ncbi:glycosyltransferase family 2 protein [Rubrivirga sp.]|uniref:glycosyltransferase family 2 protein n=1 Tax=Rubrivirga sp. TaxID=1885344 RepID=UPI003C7410A9
MTAPRFTVAICTRNRADLLRLCLDALAASIGDRAVPVVLVDNASTDDTARVADGVDLPLAYVREGQLGLSHARNTALEACETEYLVFLDDDAKPLPGWIAAIEDGIGRWTPDFFGGPYRPFYLDPKPDWFDDNLGSAHLDLEAGLQPVGTCFSGGNMGWRAALLRDMGGFDPALGMVGNTLRLGEETQLQLQYYAGHPDARAVFLPDMEMLHYVPPAKMHVAYWWRRAWDYGWRLPEIDPHGEAARMTRWELARDTKVGLPLLLRAVRRDRHTYPTWASFAVAYGGGRAGVLNGYLARRLFRPI